MATQFDYYQDDAQWGNYQYIKLEDIINNYMATRDSDDYDFASPRYRVLGHAMRIMKEFYFDVLQDVKVIELSLGPTLQVTLPPDYVDYVRISTRDEEGNLYPMAENKTLNISRAYLQDHEYNLLFDLDGNVLQGSVKRSNEYENTSGIKEYLVCYPSAMGSAPNFSRNLSKVYERGSYMIDNTTGVIRFSSDVESKDIVLEYVSDGLFIDDGQSEDQTKFQVHKFAETAMMDGIYYLNILKRRNVPANEKARARKEYYNSRRLAKRRINQSNNAEWLQAMRGSNAWIKRG